MWRFCIVLVCCFGEIDVCWFGERHLNQLTPWNTPLLWFKYSILLVPYNKIVMKMHSYYNNTDKAVHNVYEMRAFSYFDFNH